MISLVMLPEWMQRVGSSVPRGFSRFFVLEMLKPSPNLIYPLLGRLLDEKLIQETTGGKYKITKKGSTTTDDFETINNIVKNQLDVLFRIGNLGRFVALDMLERISALGTVLSENATQMTKEEIDKYKKFLKSELEKMEKSSQKKGKKININ